MVLHHIAMYTIPSPQTVAWIGMFWPVAVAVIAVVGPPQRVTASLTAAPTSSSFDVVPDLPLGGGDSDGRSPSTHYAVTVGSADGTNWVPAFVVESTAKNSTEVNQGYFSHLNEW
jgi:hypothetical protein